MPWQFVVTLDARTIFFTICAPQPRTLFVIMLDARTIFLQSASQKACICVPMLARIKHVVLQAMGAEKSRNAVTQDRTGDLQIFSLMLSQLSYRGHVFFRIRDACATSLLSCSWLALGRFCGGACLMVVGQQSPIAVGQRRAGQRWIKIMLHGSGMRRGLSNS